MLSGNAQEVNKRDTTVEMKEVMVTARSEIRKLKESAMPISVIGQRQLQGTATNINDVTCAYSWSYRAKYRRFR